MNVPNRIIEPPGEAVGARPRESGWLGELNRRVEVRASLLGVELHWPPLIVFGLPMIAVVVVGLRVAGVVGVLVAVVALVVVASIVTLLSVQRSRQRSLHTLPELALRLARSIRAGEPVERAMPEAFREIGPLPLSLTRVGRHIDEGRDVVDALEDSLQSATSGAERLLLVSLIIGVSQGGDLANALDALGDGLRDDIELHARRRLLLAQAKMSAAVLVSLPLAFAVVASAVRGSLIFRGTLGALLLFGGLLLDVLGIVWMSILMRRLR